MRAATAIVSFIIVLLVGCRESPSSPAKKSTPGAAATFILESLTAERDGDHLHLTIAAHVKNPGAVPLTLTVPVVQLFAGAIPVPPFIAPGLEPAAIQPGGESEAAMHWWLAAQDLSGPLTLEIGGSRAEVKSPRAFALDLLPENRPIPISFPDWKLP